MLNVEFSWPSPLTQRNANKSTANRTIAVTFVAGKFVLFRGFNTAHDCVASLAFSGINCGTLPGIIIPLIDQYDRCWSRPITETLSSSSSSLRFAQEEEQETNTEFMDTVLRCCWRDLHWSSKLADQVRMLFKRLKCAAMLHCALRRRLLVVKSSPRKASRRPTDRLRLFSGFAPNPPQSIEGERRREREVEGERGRGREIIKAVDWTELTRADKSWWRRSFKIVSLPNLNDDGDGD